MEELGLKFVREEEVVEEFEEFVKEEEEVVAELGQQFVREEFVQEFVRK